MKLKKKSVVAVLTLSMSMGSVLSMVPVFAETSQQNLALNKTAYVSAEYGTMPRKNLTDGNEKTRWSTESGPTQWAYIDLGQEYEMNKFQMFWENESTYASAYNIYVPCLKSGLTLVSANECAGVSISGTILTP